MSDPQPDAPTSPAVPPVVVAEPTPPEDTVEQSLVDAGMEARRVVYVEVFEL